MSSSAAIIDRGCDALGGMPRAMDLPRFQRTARGSDGRPGVPVRSFEASGFAEIRYTWSADAIGRGLGDAVPARMTITHDELSLVGARGVNPPRPTSLTRSRGGFPFESGRRQPGAQLQGYPLETLHS